MLQIKGTVVGDSIRAVKSRLGDQAYDAVVSRLEGEARALFEEGLVLASGWYSLDAFAQFLEAAVEVTARGDARVLIKRAEELTERQLSGVYQAFAKLGAPEAVIEQLSAIHRTYYRGLDIEATVVGDGRASVVYRGLEKRHWVVGPTLIGFFRKALEMSGARDVSAEFATPIEDGKGFCELVLTWSAEG
jgi:hypothetical protein